MGYEFVWIPVLLSVSASLYAASKAKPAVGGESEFDKVLKEKKEWARKVERDGRALEAWEQRDAYERKNQQEDSKEKRKAQFALSSTPLVCVAN